MDELLFAPTASQPNPMRERPLPDLTTAEGRAVAQDMLLERGWTPAELNPLPDALITLCPPDALDELACRLVELALPEWEAQTGDSSARAAVAAKRAHLAGTIDFGDLVAPTRAALEAARQARRAARTGHLGPRPAGPPGGSGRDDRSIYDPELRAQIRRAGRVPIAAGIACIPDLTWADLQRMTHLLDDHERTNRALLAYLLYGLAEERA